MTIVYLGLGSNLGPKKKNIILAIKKLSRTPGIKVKKISSFYRSRPWGYKQQPDFLNAVVQISTSWPPTELFQMIKNIEKEIGRKKSRPWGPRKIDLDILLYGQKIIRRPNLTVPHRYLLKRLFVLEPLMEIAPRLRHPITRKMIKRYYERFLVRANQEVVLEEKLPWKRLLFPN